MSMRADYDLFENVCDGEKQECTKSYLRGKEDVDGTCGLFDIVKPLTFAFWQKRFVMSFGPWTFAI